MHQGMACTQKKHSILFGGVTNTDESTWSNDAQKSEAGHLLLTLCRENHLITVRDTLTILQLPLAFSFHVRPYAIACGVSSRRRRPLVVMSKGHVKFNV